MSSLRNAVKRITHKERSQPRARAHLGILQKKKDYKKRANDYHRKQDLLNSLRRKASMRNPDEFYFGMNKSEIKDGKHNLLQEEKDKRRMDEIGHDAVRVMKDQDLSYIRMHTLKDQKKVEKMRANLQYICPDDDNENDEMGRTSGKRKHTIFVESQDEAENFDVANHFQTIPEFAGRTFNRLRKETLLKMGNNDNENGKKSVKSRKELKREEILRKKQARTLSKARSSAYAELEARKKRINALKVAEAHLVTEKIVASKGRKRKIKGEMDGKPAVYKFRRKRAR